MSHAYSPKVSSRPPNLRKSSICRPIFLMTLGPGLQSSRARVIKTSRGQTRGANRSVPPFRCLGDLPYFRAEMGQPHPNWRRRWGLSTRAEWYSFDGRGLADYYGQPDMIGNVWEWTTDWWSTRHEADAPKACCIPENPRGGPECRELRPLPTANQNIAQGPQSRLAPVRAEICRRYRPAAGHAEAVDYLDQPRRISMRHSQTRERESHEQRRR